MKKFGLKSSLATIGVLFMALLLLGSCNKKEAPSAPTNLTAVLNGDCIHLSWKGVPHADYYRITVGFLMRDSFNQLTEVYEVPLAEVSSTVYDDCFPFEGPNFYKIEAVNEYGSSPCSEISCDYPYPANRVALYPNPTSTYVAIEAENMRHITVMNFDGETLTDLEMNSIHCTLSLGEYDSGIYFIHIFSDLGETVKRVVKL